MTTLHPEESLNANSAKLRMARMDQKEKLAEFAHSRISRSEPESHMIETHKIVKTYKNAAGEFLVLKGVDLTIERGQFVSIVGKS